LLDGGGRARNDEEEELSSSEGSGEGLGSRYMRGIMAAGTIVGSGSMKESSGRRAQASQRRRWRWGSEAGGSGLEAQFWGHDVSVRSSCG
jgi:hypothetical protein